MTTAARPTWAPAKGGQEQGGTRMFGPSQKFSARDLRSHTTLKTRKEGQGTEEELRAKDLRLELEERERKHFESKPGAQPGAPPRDPPKLLLQGSNYQAKSLDADDSDDGDDGGGSGSDEDDEDEDEDAALMAELENIRKEKAAEKLRKEREKQMEDAKAKEAELSRGNPLLNGGGSGGSFTVKRRWNEDVVFKNQARGEIKQPKRFINDTIRSDFHRKFLNKYMK